MWFQFPFQFWNPILPGPHSDQTGTSMVLALQQPGRLADRIIPLWPCKAIFIQLSLIVKKCQMGPFGRQWNSRGALLGRKLSHRMATLLITKHSEGKKLVGSLATSWGSLSFTIGSDGSWQCTPRYLGPGTQTTSTTFVIPMNGCGTALSEPDPTSLESESQMKTGFSNIIIVQMDEEVQEVWDTARKINCEWVQYVEKKERSCFYQTFY